MKPGADVKAPAVASKPAVAGLKPAGVKSPVVAGKTPTSVAKSAVSTAVHAPAAKSMAGPKSVPSVKSGNTAVAATAPVAQAKPVVVSNESHWVTSSKGSGASKGPVAKGKAGTPGVKAPAKSTSKTAAKTRHAGTAVHPVGPGVKQ